jgi:hypothetical protein
VRDGALRLEDEDGQSLIVAVAFLLGIVLMLALVVNLGFWYASQRRIQSVADAVALAVASPTPNVNTGCNPAPTTTQELADCYANRNWASFTTDGSVTVDTPGDGSVSVHVTHPVPGFFTSLIGEAFGTVTVGAHATAAIQGPAAPLNNSKLRAIQQTPAYVAPLVVDSDTCGTPPWPSFCLGATQSPLLIEGDPYTSHINVVDLSCATGVCLGPSATTVANWITCGPCLQGDLGINSYVPAVSTTVLDSCPQTNGHGPHVCTIRRALNAVRNKMILVAVSDGWTGGGYHIVGYAALTITNLPSNSNWPTQTRKTITVKFQSFTPTPYGSGTAPQYGLQTIGLTG